MDNPSDQSGSKCRFGDRRAFQASGAVGRMPPEKLPVTNAEAAGDHKGDGQGEQPFAHFGAGIDRVGTPQEEITADACRDAAQHKSQGQPTVELTHALSLSWIETGQMDAFAWQGCS